MQLVNIGGLGWETEGSWFQPGCGQNMVDACLVASVGNSGPSNQVIVLKSID